MECEHVKKDLACESGGVGEAIGGQGEWFVVQRVGEWRGCVKWS